MDNPSIFIDISDEEWKILQIRRDKGRITFKRCDVINARNRAPAEFERDLKSVPVVRNAETIVSLPRKKVIFKHLRLPSSDLNLPMPRCEAARDVRRRRASAAQKLQVPGRQPSRYPLHKWRAHSIAQWHGSGG